MKSIMTNAESPPQPASLTVEQALQKAIAHHLAGQSQDAERLYRAILQTQPNHPDANHNLGVLAVQTRQPAAALPYFKVALEANPNRGQYWLSYIDALIQTNQVNVARQALAQGRRQGLSDEAVEAFAGRLEEPGSQPTAQEIETLMTLFTEQRYTEAAGIATSMTVRFPLHGFGWKALGAVFKEMGQNADALASMQKAAALLPNDAEAHSNLANVLQNLGSLDKAEASYRRALEIKPDYAEVHNGLANIFQDLGRLDEAEASYRRALKFNPDFAGAHNNLGNILHDQGRLDQAEASYRRALEIMPNLAMAHSNLGNTLRDMGRLVDAEASYRHALEIAPDSAQAHSNLIFILDLLEDYSIAEQQAERRRWYAQHGRKYAEPIPPHENQCGSDRKLRVGYVSADFRRHSACYIFGPIIRLHDRSAFEVFCYSGVKMEDEVTVHLRQSVQQWQSSVGVSDEALAEKIRHDRIDILVDLSGHSAGNRLLVFARKPAPVQVTAWGYATGTGLETIDYFLADSVIVPREERSLYAEEVIDLPCVLCYEPPDYLPEVSPLPALGATPFTFGCINRIEKITDRVISLWGRILAALPEAQLLLKDRMCDDPTVRQYLLRRLHAAGIAAERVRILGQSRHPEHLKAFHEVDLGLDPFPHGGGISTAEALWMGVPVVTLSGLTVTSRLSASVLTASTMQNWIARSEEDYVRIAVEAARDLPWLARLRSELRSQVAASLLGDMQRYTREVEAAFRSMWRRWCAENTPTSSKIKR